MYVRWCAAPAAQWSIYWGTQLKILNLHISFIFVIKESLSSSGNILEIFGIWIQSRTVPKVFRCGRVALFHNIVQFRVWVWVAKWVSVQIQIINSVWVCLPMPLLLSLSQPVWLCCIQFFFVPSLFLLILFLLLSFAIRTWNFVRRSRRLKSTAFRSLLIRICSGILNFIFFFLPFNSVQLRRYYLPLSIQYSVSVPRLSLSLLLSFRLLGFFFCFILFLWRSTWYDDDDDWSFIPYPCLLSWFSCSSMSLS